MAGRALFAPSFDLAGMDGTTSTASASRSYGSIRRSRSSPTGAGGSIAKKKSFVSPSSPRPFEIPYSSEGIIVEEFVQHISNREDQDMNRVRGFTHYRGSMDHGHPVEVPELIQKRSRFVGFMRVIRKSTSFRKADRQFY